MRSRRLLVILVIFIVLCGMAIIGGTVFRVRNINIVFTSTKDIDRNTVGKTLQRELDYLKGKSILFEMDKQKIKDIVENTEIFIKVINIKAEFPNSITIDVRERYPVFLYKESNSSTFVLDAEMRVLYKDDYTGSEDELTDISLVGGGLFKTNIAKGGYVLGDGEVNQEKIELINIIPNFFASNGSYEASMVHQIRDVSFGETVAGLVIMNINVKPENHDAIDVKLTVMKAVGEDFAELFACVWATMERELPYKIEDEKGTIIKTGIKGSSQAGNYTVYYAEDGRLEVLFDSTDPDDRYDVKFVPIGGS